MKKNTNRRGSSLMGRLTNRAPMMAAVLLTIGVPSVVSAAPPLLCAPGSQVATVQGKIQNNAIAPGETLGVVALNVLDTRQRLKCGIHGVATADGSGFTHTLVCDDEIPVALGTSLHSQVTLDTRFVAPPLLQPCGPSGLVYGSFKEISDPVPGTGRGLFAATGGGRIFVEGTINCAAAIDMKFHGSICVSQ